MHAKQFMELVFRTPANWQEDSSCRNVLTFITAHDDFKKALKSFLQVVKGPGTEHRLYPFVVSLYAVVLKLLDQRDPLPDGHDRQTLKLAFSVNDPTELVDGVINRLSPESLFHSFCIHDKGLSFSNLIHVVEVRDTNAGSTLCRGDNDPRILHEGLDPRLAKQASPANSGGAGFAASDGTTAGMGGSASRKRKRTDYDAEGLISGRKIGPQSKEAFSAGGEAQNTEDPLTQVDLQTQCARYAMEHLSDVILRSHSILTLFDRDQVQFEYFDRSVIAVSSAVDLSTEEGQTLFILMLYGLRRLSPEDLGLRNVQDAWNLCTESASKHVVENGSGDWRRLFYDRRMEIENETYTLKEIVFREPGLIGRSTCVVGSIRSSDEKRFVVKISCPTATRVPETKLIQRARNYAEADEKHAWVLNHLPNMIASKDVMIDEKSVQGRMRDFLSRADYADGKTYNYEDRCLRLCVSEELHAITSLTSQHKIAQVFLDILQTHKWLYDVPKILHRDLSASNIMFRVDEAGNVYGVPNDLDLASLVSDLESESGSTSLLTGTPPFLQKPHKFNVRHLYRHDLESLFYVLLMLVCRHDIVHRDKYYQELRENPPFEEWFDGRQSWAELHRTKGRFYWNRSDFIESCIAPGFNEFKEWVIFLWKVLARGFLKRREAEMWRPQAEDFTIDERLYPALKAGHLKEPVMKAKLTVDNETLGGEVSYWTFFQHMTQLNGYLLEIRCLELGMY
ncbi:hypothetical protein BDZ89DRAFT_1162891 [Hymenopellis radicata]|nr:hypothetical protein BDZ89DRAFT_1162891 [Hymenopellis radicata]